MGAVDQVAHLEFRGGFASGAGAAGDLGHPSGLGVDWDVQDLRRMERIDIFPERRGLLAELELVRVSLPPAPPKPHPLACCGVAGSASLLIDHKSQLRCSPFAAPSIKLKICGFEES
ncbi:MAG TPA: hypothetical protein VGT99_08560 [Gammaproteobacteria bacterium]|nr:hypothetical protein [Gammaproteobacteria bacterium]